MSYFYPGQDNTAVTTAMLQEHYAASFADPNIPPPLLFGRQIAGIREVGGITGTARQGFLFAEGAPPVLQNPGDNPSGQVLAQDEYLITRQDVWITATHEQRYNEQAYTPEGLRQSGRFGAVHRRMIDGEADRRFARLVNLGARSAAASSQSQFIHAGGTQVLVSGTGASTAAAALAARYPLTSTGGSNAYTDLCTLADKLDRRNAPRGVGARPIWFTVDMYNALLRYAEASTGGLMFSKDYITEGVGNDVQKREVQVVHGFTVMGVVLPDLETGSSVGYNGGIMPALNVTTGPSNCQGNFLPATGTPACFGMHETPGGVPVVEWWKEFDLKNIFEANDFTKIMKWHSAMLLQCGLANPSGAYNIELQT